ncbi:GTPase [Pullulanibacillus camelliae]|uniref:GTPase n=1 Tax=Pullulanibacillus camelliae TaxID=1707096 RepID=A0A8J2YD90_9BACL|nr:dynamin family protein [Pullulanibacillus camelliae]GGE39358.1 GTPase [Pullulanibacillus camelliae]
MKDTSGITFKNEDTLLSLYELFNKHGDALRARQTFNLLKKHEARRFDVCFCGHFSAGKSSLLNTLMQEDLLPTSPIPTSANLVSISHGTPEIQIVFWDGRLVSFTPPYDLKVIKQHAKNGAEVSEIRVKTLADFPPYWGLMDTPGIDSTDPAHQAATEEAVQLADVIFYVADYNHMQAADNFHFLKSIQALNKPFHIIVTQMDKHKESEIRLVDYKKKVEEGLASWGLSPLSLHYVSIVEPASSRNDIAQLKTLLQELQHNGQPADAVDDALIQHLIDTHKQWWINTHKREMDAYKDRLMDTDIRQLNTTYVDLQQQKEAAVDAKENWTQAVVKKTNQTINSAILMPYETREAARSFLEAYQPKFKVGMFSTKQKVEKARLERLDIFFKHLSDHVNTLRLQTTDTLSQEIETLIGKQEAVQAIILGISFSLKRERLVELIHSGATLSGDYLLRYTEDVAEDIKKTFRRLVQEALQQIEGIITPQLADHLQQIDDQVAQLQDQFDAASRYETLSQEQQHYFEQLDTLSESHDLFSTESIEQVKAAIAELPIWTTEQLPDSFKTKRQETLSPLLDVEAKAVPVVEQEKITDIQVDQDQINHWSEQFARFSQALKAVHGFEAFVTNLENKADRLAHQTFTIALFGAFSAGKSSFANSLLGEQVLPVSPHPTTATINRILPVDADHPHKTAHIKLKTEAALLGEINEALAPFHLAVERLEDINNVINKLSEKEHEHLTFLLAAARGWQAVAAHLGTTLTVSLDEAQEFIADETKACFVETASIYYNCDITRQGLILVDTPGADSINARHTEAAFHYIKNADAILYVTYYNHAFSRADEEFLIQLGRVKDAFELDKMFFLVNAIDLARDPQEVEDVKNYVEDRLLSFGIRQPRLFGVSSHLVLQAKQEGVVFSEQADNSNDPSGFQAFYQEWMHYIQNDLKGQIVTQGNHEIQQVKTIIHEVLDSASLDENERRLRQQNIQAEFTDIQALLARDHIASYTERLKQEIKDYYFYVKKRVMQRYLDTFTRFFNPAVLQKNASGSKKALLTGCLEECIQFLSFDLDQEGRATFIRIESVLDRLAKERQTLLAHQLSSIGKGWPLQGLNKREWTSAEIVASLKEMSITAYQDVFKHYKNPKQFFEGDGQKLFREALRKQLDKAIDRIIDENMSKVSDHYEQQWYKTITAIDEQNKNALTTIYEQRLEALQSDQTLINQYKALLDQLN